MAWTTPRTFVTGELETASIFNTHLRDNLNALHDGYMISGKASGTITFGGADTLNRDYSPWTSVSWQNGATFFTSGHINIPLAGYYLIHMSAESYSAPGNAMIQFNKNSGTRVRPSTANMTNGDNNEGLNAMFIDLFAANDTIQPNGWNSGGGTCSCTVEVIKLPLL